MSGSGTSGAGREWWDTRTGILVEQLGLWLGTLLLVRAVVMINQAGVHEIVLALVPVLFMYVPVTACWYRKADSWQYPLALPFDSWKPWTDALKINALLIGVVAVPFVVLYHYWQTLVFGFEYEGTLPSSMLMLVGYHLFFVAIPEEMFYRGYMQSRLDELWEPRWNVFGVKMGPGWLLTCVLFAFGHSIVILQWWHFAIILPSLVFGWLRQKTNDILAGALFHAWCNITVATLDTMYGIIPP